MAVQAPSIIRFFADSGVLGDGITDANVLTLTGTGVSGSVIKVFDGSTLLGSTTATSAGVWSLETAALSDTTHRFSATATDATGDTSAPSAVMSVTVVPSVTDFAATPNNWGDPIHIDNVPWYVETAGQPWSLTNPDTHTVRTEVRYGDLWASPEGDDTSRAEILTAAFPDDQLFNVAYTMTVEPGTLNIPAASWLSLTQFHELGLGAPPFSIMLNGENMEVVLKPGAYGEPGGHTVIYHDPNPIQRGHAYDIQIQVKFDMNGAGFIDIWRDGVQIVDYQGTVGTDPGTQYLKLGVYRGWPDDAKYTMAVDYSNIVISGDPNFPLPSGNPPTQQPPSSINHAPVVTASDQSASPGQIINASSLFSASDIDNDTLAYYLYDDTPGAASGHFTVNGVVQAANTVIAVSAAQLAQTTFTAGSVADDLTVGAYDGKTYSAAAEFHINVTAGPAQGSSTNHAPVVTATDRAATSGQVFSASSLFSATDADHDTLTYYLYDDTPGAASGHFTVNGVMQTANTVIAVSAAQLAQTTFTAGSVADDLIVGAYDGKTYSAAAEFHINVTAGPAQGNSANHAPVITATDHAATPGQVFSASSLFSATDADHDTLTYVVYDNTRGAASGHFTIDGAVQPSHTAVHMSANELAHATFTAGSVADHLFVAAYDGATFSVPKEFHVDIV